MNLAADFELRRLHDLLKDRLVPGCTESTFLAEDIEVLKREINWEGEKIYVEVMKVMCRDYSEEHLSRYLEVHLYGAETLQERLRGLIIGSNALCVELFESLKGVLEEVLSQLGSWKKRHFDHVGFAELTEQWWRADQVMKELGISQRTLYTYTQEGMFVISKKKRTTFYSKESVMRLK